MPRCKSCGAWADEDERFCQHCGVKIPDDASGDRWEKSAVEDTGSDRELDPEKVRERAMERKLSVDEDLPPPKREPPLEYMLRHPLRRGRRPLVVSALLLLGSVFVLPALVLAGYSFRLGRSVVFEAEQPPEYDDLGSLIIDGIRLAIVASLPTLLWSVGTLLLIGVLLLTVPAAEGIVSFVLLFSVAGFLWLVGTYIVAFIGNDSVVEAFTDERSRVLRSDPAYLRSWLVVLVFTVLVLVAVTVAVGPLFVLLALGVPPLLVALLSPVSLAGAGLALAYAVLVGVTYAGYVYHEAADRGLVPPPEENVGMAPGNMGIAETD